MKRILLLAMFLMGGCQAPVFIFSDGEEGNEEPLESPRSIQTYGNGYDNLDYGEPIESDFTTNRPGYALGFACPWRQPYWVAYRLTPYEASTRKVKRTNRFKDDPDVPCSATLDDYRHSGYDRGHLAPAGDMAWSKEAMEDSFLMSNMSPQIPDFNRGIWRELEMLLRIAASNGSTLFIYTGPLFKECQCTNSIGRDVLVPDAFFKAVYNENPTNEAMIAFLVPNVGTNAPLSEFAMTIDELEGILKMDFFKELPIEKQYELESKLELDKWTGL